jgi:regulatory protein
MAFQRAKPTRALTPDEALSKLEYFCAYRERCSKEVRERLRELGIRGADAEQIFEVLQGDGFFDDARFAIAFAGGKFRVNHWGRVRIRIELKMRQLPPDIIEAALDHIEASEYERILQELIEKKMRYYDGDHQAREKTVAALMRAGFEADLIFRWI